MSADVERDGEREEADAEAASDPFDLLRRATRARVALGRAGDALPTREVLAFSAAHAAARDAVHTPVDVEALTSELAGEGEQRQVVVVHSRATDRATYLTRPDLGRLLDEDSAARLDGAEHGHDLVVVVADGLSARAVQEHAAPVVSALLERLDDAGGWSVGPVVLAQQARVALGDDVGQRLEARMVVVLVGERPGLTSPDSLGAYLTSDPEVGRKDSERNCVSNVRPPDGQSYETAADTLVRLLVAGRDQGTGVGLKDDGELETGREHDDAAR